MKKYRYAKWLGCLTVAAMMSGCNDYLDITPPTGIPPEDYFNSDTELAAYVDDMYEDFLPSHGGMYSWGMFGWDSGTDNMIGQNPSSSYIGTWYTGMSDGNYSFSKITRCNYFFNYVMPKYEAGELDGEESLIKHYIGEVYFMRAVAYFDLYKQFGDVPIVTELLPDDQATLVEASKRFPRNEVARFIMSDLDIASGYFKDTDASTPGVAEKSRISNDAAMLLKSRLGLYEGTWLKYHEDYVPGGSKWTGRDMYPNYQYPAGSREAEINYFLERAYEAADSVVANHPLVENTGHVQQSADEDPNPYMDMYATEDMSGYSEVVLWRPYSRTLGVGHCVVYNAQVTNAGVGTTRSLVNSFLMADGKPTYASSYTYEEDGISKVRQNRDARITVWLKQPGQVNYFINVDSELGEAGQITEPTNPAIASTDDSKGKAVTGYTLRMGNSYDKEQNSNTGGYTGSPSYMASEAYLNYIEAYYERHHERGGNVDAYWTELRQKHGRITASIQTTIDATNMGEETAETDCNYDWGAYSKGAPLTDPILYSIRRERRCELMGLGLRDMDLKRWRSMDQLKTTKYHVEGFQLWADESGKIVSEYRYRRLQYDPADPKSTVSAPNRSLFLRPYEILLSSTAYDGLGWHNAYYLRPIPIKQFDLCGEGILYQNYGWSLEANDAPLD